MNFQEKSFEAMRFILKRPATVEEIGEAIERTKHHTLRSLDKLIERGYMSVKNDNGTRYYSLTIDGLEKLNERDGVKHTIKYEVRRFHPNINWPWTYREAA